MTGTEFHNKLKEYYILIEEEKESPEGLEYLLLERIRNNCQTFNSTLLLAVNSWRNYELKNIEQTGLIDYKRTLNLIDSLLGETTNNIQLKAKLLSVKSDIYTELGKTDEVTEILKVVAKELHSLHLDVDLLRIDNLLRLAQNLLLSGNNEEAEKIFLDILSYPWYLIMEPDFQEALKNNYINAGKGLIKCRWGNLEALNDTFFVPATHPYLLPELEIAINEAKNVK